MADDHPHDDPHGEDTPPQEPEGSSTDPGEPDDVGTEPDAANEPAGTDGSDDAGTGEPAGDEPEPPPEPAPNSPDAMTVASPQGHATSDLAEPERPWADWPGRNTANERNAALIGELRVYYTERTVAVPMDADAALRAMAGWRHGHVRLWEDLLDPAESPGTASWATLSLDGVLAMVWLPGLPREPRPHRMALDPAVA